MSPDDASAAQDGPQDALGEAYHRETSVAELHAEAARSAGDERAARRSLLRIAGLTVLLLAALDVVLRVVLPPSALLLKMPEGLGAYYIKLDEFERVPTPDVLFLGSSRMARAVDPELVERQLAARLGRPLTAFNLGLNNAKLEELSTVVRSHVEDPPPPYVVLGFSGTELVRDFDFQYASRFLWSVTDVVAYLRRTPFQRVEWRHVERYLQQLLGDLWYLYDQRGPIKEELLFAARDALGQVGAAEQAMAARLQRAAADMLTSRRGFWAGTEFDTGSDLAQRLQRDPTGVRVPPRELSQPLEILEGTGFPLLREIIERLEARGCKVALVEVPPSPWLAAKNPVMHGAGLPPSPRHPAGLAGCRTRLAELAADLAIPFVAFDARESGLTNADYVDGNHMSLAGARRYTGLLVKRLLELGFFGPAR